MMVTLTWWPPVPVCQGLRAVLGCRTSGAQTRKVAGNLGMVGHPRLIRTQLLIQTDQNGWHFRGQWDRWQRRIWLDISREGSGACWGAHHPLCWELPELRFSRTGLLRKEGAKFRGKREVGRKWEEPKQRSFFRRGGSNGTSPSGPVVKTGACNAGVLGLIPGWETRSCMLQMLQLRPDAAKQIKWTYLFKRWGSNHKTWKINSQF